MRLKVRKIGNMDSAKIGIHSNSNTIEKTMNCAYNFNLISQLECEKLGSFNGLNVNLNNIDSKCLFNMENLGFSACSQDAKYSLEDFCLVGSRPFLMICENHASQLLNTTVKRYLQKTKLSTMKMHVKQHVGLPATRPMNETNDDITMLKYLPFPFKIHFKNEKGEHLSDAEAVYAICEMQAKQAAVDWNRDLEFRISNLALNNLNQHVANHNLMKVFTGNQQQNMQAASTKITTFMRMLFYMMSNASLPGINHGIEAKILPEWNAYCRRFEYQIRSTNAERFVNIYYHTKSKKTGKEEVLTCLVPMAALPLFYQFFFLFAEVSQKKPSQREKDAFA